jgi:hypothetical protein
MTNDDTKEAEPAVVSQFLKASKALCLSLGQRQSISSRLCPFNSYPEEDEEKRKQLAALAEIDKNITTQIKALRELEAQNKNIGVSRLIGSHSQNDGLYCAVLLMALSRLNESLHREVRDVAGLLSLATQDVVETHLLRGCFRTTNGLLRQFVHIIDNEEPNVDQLRFEMSDLSYATVVGSRPTESEVAHSILGRERYPVHRR